MKCYWCGKTSNNFLMDIDTKEVKMILPCDNCKNQPERSKREDRDFMRKELCDYFGIKLIDDRECGALNTEETP